MKKNQLLIVFIILCVYTLGASVKDWLTYEKSPNFPLYELVDEHEMLDEEKLHYKLKRQKIKQDIEIPYKYTEDFKLNSKSNRKEDHHTLRDLNGNELWSIPISGYFSGKNFGYSTKWNNLRKYARRKWHNKMVE